MVRLTRDAAEQLNAVMRADGSHVAPLMLSTINLEGESAMPAQKHGLALNADLDCRQSTGDD